MRTRAQKGSWVSIRHLANGEYTTGPGQSPAQDVFFLMFGGTGCAPDKCTGPLGKILSYKNLI